MYGEEYLQFYYNAIFYWEILDTCVLLSLTVNTPLTVAVPLATTGVHHVP